MQSITEGQEPKRKITPHRAVEYILKLVPRKYDRYVTRGFYLNIPQEIIEQMELRPHELVELTIKKLR